MKTQLTLAKKAIKELLNASKNGIIRYNQIEHIEKHHEALNSLEEKNLVYVEFNGYKVTIEKLWS